MIEVPLAADKTKRAARLAVFYSHGRRGASGQTAATRSLTTFESSRNRIAHPRRFA
jgi:hypothetical protein